MLIIIDNYDSFTYNLAQACSAFFDNVEIFRNDAISVEQVSAMSPQAILLSPGPGRPEQAGICIELITALSPRTPILGVCLGHQAIGAAFGARITTAPDILHGKSSPAFHDRKGLFETMPLPLEAGRYHSLVVERKSLPGDLIVDADTADGTIMAMHHVDYPCYGLQFHPESILTPDGPAILQRFADLAKTRPSQKEYSHAV